MEGREPHALELRFYDSSSDWMVVKGYIPAPDRMK